MNKLWIYSLLLIGLFTACNDETTIENQEELITTVRYELTPRGGGNNIQLTFQDLDGDGGNAPTTTISGKLQAGITYDGVLSLLNETETPAEDITIEIRDEAEAHQFFYETSPQIQISYNDADQNGRPIGLKTVLTAGTAAAAQAIKITLRHEADKAATGVSDGNIQNAGGETDIEVAFIVDIE